MNLRVNSQYKYIKKVVILINTINIIKCPYCNAEIEPWDFLDTGDMEGDFSMECLQCKKEFNVTFTTDVRFISSKID